MTLDELLRANAIFEIHSYWPRNHYRKGERDSDPEADLELVTLVLGDSRLYRLSPMQACAVDAIKNWAIYQLGIRETWPTSDINPVADTELLARLLRVGRSEKDGDAVPSITIEQGRDIWVLREVFRRSAFVYARMKGDKALEEYFQTPEPAPENLCYGSNVVRPAPKLSEKVSAQASVKPVSRHNAQESAILAAIATLGLDPKRLPKSKQGTPGVKMDVRAVVSKDSLFVGRTVFDKAWQRMRDSEDLVDED